MNAKIASVLIVVCAIFIGGCPVPDDIYELREQLVSYTGDYSLVGQNIDGTPNYNVDAGADHFINAGMDSLCDLAPELARFSKKYLTLSAGQYWGQIPLLMQAIRCEIIAADGAITPLEGPSVTKLSQYEEENGRIDSTTPGEPTNWFYCPDGYFLAEDIAISPLIHDWADGFEVYQALVYPSTYAFFDQWSQPAYLADSPWSINGVGQLAYLASSGDPDEKREMICNYFHEQGATINTIKITARIFGTISPESELRAVIVHLRRDGMVYVSIEQFSIDGSSDPVDSTITCYLEGPFEESDLCYVVWGIVTDSTSHTDNFVIDMAVENVPVSTYEPTLLFGPRADVEYRIGVDCRVYHDRLSNANITNALLQQNHGILVLFMSCVEWERKRRNKSGVQYWLGEVNQKLETRRGGRNATEIEGPPVDWVMND